MCEYLLLIPIDVASFKLIKGQIKELQGVVPNTPRAENDQKSPVRIGLKNSVAQARCEPTVFGFQFDTSPT